MTLSQSQKWLTCLALAFNLWLYCLEGAGIVYDTNGTHNCLDDSCDTFTSIEMTNNIYFGLLCSDISCQGNTIIVESGCTMNSDGIDCFGSHSACSGTRIKVYDSDLTTGGGVLDCATNNKNGVCDFMQITLDNSQLQVYCGSGDCDEMSANLSGASQLIIDPLSADFAAGTPLIVTLGTDAILNNTGNVANIEVIRLTTTKTPATTTDTPTTTTETPPTTTKTPTTTTKIPTTTELPTTTEVTTEGPVATTTKPPTDTTTVKPEESTTVKPQPTEVSTEEPTENTMEDTTTQESHTTTIVVSTPSTETTESGEGSGNGGGIPLWALALLAFFGAAVLGVSAMMAYIKREKIKGIMGLHSANDDNIEMVAENITSVPMSPRVVQLEMDTAQADVNAAAIAEIVSSDSNLAANLGTTASFPTSVTGEPVQRKESVSGSISISDELEEKMVCETPGGDTHVTPGGEGEPEISDSYSDSSVLD